MNSELGAVNKNKGLCTLLIRGAIRQQQQQQGREELAPLFPPASSHTAVHQPTTFSYWSRVFGHPIE